MHRPSRLPTRLRDLLTSGRRPARTARPRRAWPGLEALESKQLLTSFTVTSAGDSGPGTLRQAILDINSEPADGFTDDEIDFAIPGAGVHTIAPATPLPSMKNPVDVDATTQPGYAGTPLVVLDGINATAPDGSPVVGLRIAAGTNEFGAAVRGLGIVRFSGSALQVDTFGTQVVGDDLGTDAAGDPGLGNGGYGVLFGINGGNHVTDCLIENNALRAIGGLGDAPGSLTKSSPYVTISGLTDSGNDTQATTLIVAADGGFVAHADTTFGGTTTVTYTVTNTGTLPATDVVVNLDQNAFLQDLTVTGATTSQGTIDTTDRDDSGGYPSFASLGTLAPGASATLTVTVQFGSEADFPNGFAQLTAIASSPQLDYDPFETAATFDFQATDPDAPPPTPTPSLIVETPTPNNFAFPHWGDTVTLSFLVTNTGTATADGVTLSLGLADYDAPIFKLLAATTTQGTVVADPSFDGGQPQINIGSLAPGASATVTFTARVVDQDDPAALVALAASKGAAPVDVVVATVGSSDVTPEPDRATDDYVFTINQTDPDADQGGGTVTVTGTTLTPASVAPTATPIDDGGLTPTATPIDDGGLTPSNPTTGSPAAPVVVPVVQPIINPVVTVPVPTSPVTPPSTVAPVVATPPPTTAAPVVPVVGPQAPPSTIDAIPTGRHHHRTPAHFAAISSRHRLAATDHAALMHRVRVGHAHPVVATHAARHSARAAHPAAASLARKHRTH